MNEKIKYILDFADIAKVNCFLDTINLKDNERKALQLVDLKGYTQMQASIVMQVSTRTVQNYRTSAFKKIEVIIDTNTIAQEILSTAK